MLVSRYGCKDLIQKLLMIRVRDRRRLVPFRLVKAMAKEYAKGFYASEAWHKCRLGYIAHRRGIDGGICEECGESLGYIVHHRKHISPANINKPEITLGWDNLEYVCKECHERIHDKCSGENSQRRIYFTPNGEPELVPS